MKYNESLKFYNQLSGSEYLTMTPIYYSEIVLPNGENQIVSKNYNEKHPKARVAGLGLDTNYLTLATLEWISTCKEEAGCKDVLIQTLVYWKKSPATWNRHDYIVLRWDGEAKYMPKTANGLTETSVTSITILDGPTFSYVNDCTYNVDLNKSVTFKGRMEKSTVAQQSWNYTGYFAEASLHFKETFSYKVSYYHDQGLLPYTDILNKVKINVLKIEFPLSFLGQLKEYTPSDTGLIYFR